MKKAVVLGLGISGKAAAEFLLKEGWNVVGVDSQEKALQLWPLSEVPVYNDREFVLKSDVERVVVSPGIPPFHPLYREAKERGIEVIGEAELALRKMNQRGVAITGTNGKTTVTQLTAHVLNHSGIPAKPLGNIGDPLCSYFMEPDENEVIVAELSSYQLETIDSPVFDAAIILNITPDHLDRYGSMDEYEKAKFRIARTLKPGAQLYLNDALTENIPDGISFIHFGRKPGAKYWTDQRGILFDERREVLYPHHYLEYGIHDCENVLAAWLLVQKFGVSVEQFVDAIRIFEKPSHRVEFVARFEGIAFYDDSKGTNLDAVIQAVATLKGSVVLIAGGVHKGSSYKPWISSFQGKVKRVIAIGQAASRIAADLSEAIEVAEVGSLEEAVKEAFQFAKSGDNVLLSPGCSSFDMFRDYAHRGEEFQRCVNELLERRKE